MKKTCQTCPDLRQSLFWFSVQFLVMLGFLFLMASQNVFAEISNSDEAEAQKSYGTENKDLVCETGSCTNENLLQPTMQLVSDEETIDPIIIIIGPGA